jgi:3-oxoadipate enol-lactonase
MRSVPAAVPGRRKSSGSTVGIEFSRRICRAMAEQRGRLRSIERSTPWGAAVDDGGEKTHLVGISGGGVVCLLAYLEHAPQVAGLVLSGGLARAPRWFVLQRAMTRLAPESALARMMRGALSGGSADYADAAVADFRRCGKPTFLNALRELADLELRARLSEVTVPTLVLCGEDDRPNISLSRELAAGIPTAELRLVPSANHLWNLQQPEVFNETVAAFVDKAETPKG